MPPVMTNGFLEEAEVYSIRLVGSFIYRHSESYKNYQELYEECIAQLQRSKENPDESNTTLQDIKRCKRTAVPKLVSLHRSPSLRGGERADDV